MLDQVMRCRDMPFTIFQTAVIAGRNIEFDPRGRSVFHPPAQPNYKAEGMTRRRVMAAF